METFGFQFRLVRKMLTEEVIGMYNVLMEKGYTNVYLGGKVRASKNGGKTPIF